MIDQLLRHERPHVRAAAAEALAAVPSMQSFELLLPLLERADTRRSARRALLALGDEALERLARELANEGASHRLRRHLPRSISRFESPRALEILQQHLPAERDGAVRYKCLRGMGRIVQEHPEYPLDRTLIHESIRNHLQRIYRFDEWQLRITEGAAERPELRSSEAHELLVVALEEKRRNALERVFRCLQMLRPDESFELYWRALDERTSTLRAASRELVEHAVPPAYRETLLAMIDDGGLVTRVERAALSLERDDRPRPYEVVVREIMSDPSETLRGIAAYHGDELGLEVPERLRVNPIAKECRGRIPGLTGAMPIDPIASSAGSS